MPFAERTGLGRALSSFVLAEAVAELARLTDDERAPGRISVNLSMVDLLDLELPEEVERLLFEAGVDAHRLELEITEGVIMADPVRVRSVLERLRALGVKLAIDDFGTGYSSLAYLKNLPVDVLKIDRSFVSAMVGDPRDAAVVRSTLDMARALGLGVVAEGVEDMETYELLRGLGCDVAQGYLIGKPVPADELLDAADDWLGRAPTAHVAAPV